MSSERKRRTKFKRRSRARSLFGRAWARLLLLLLLCASAALFSFFKDFYRKVPLPADDGGGYSQSIVYLSADAIPPYSGQDAAQLNNGVPCFTKEYISSIEGEHYSDLDYLGRCGQAVALLDRGMMPKEPREAIGDVRPSGWVQGKYPGIIPSDPPYLYNRSHLIAHAMTGQNANGLNLITGTRHMNAVTMLSYEEKVLRYLDRSDGHVLYRVTPYFKDDELVARGVELEAYSVEDEGAGVCFHVFLYNVQPGIDIDYRTGENRAMQ